MGILRIILALSVLFGHAPIAGLSWHPLVPGEIAVEVFFMISGFYMSLVLTEKYKIPTGATDKKSFWTARALKIYPYYWATLILLVSFYVAKGVNFQGLSNLVDQNPLITAWLFLSNIFIVGLDGLLFLRQTHNEWSLMQSIHDTMGVQPYRFITIPPTWTLSLELMFYLLAPYIHKLRSASIFLLIGLSVAARIITYHAGYNDDPWSYRFFPFELTFFLAGMLMHRAYHNGFLTSPILIIPVMFGIIFFPLLSTTKVDGFWLEGTLFLIAGCLALPSLFHLTKNWPLDRKIGEISYPLYVLHMPVIAILSASHLDLTPGQSTIAIVSISLIGAFVLDSFVAKAVLSYKKNKVASV